MMKRLFTTMTKPNLFYHKELVVMLYEEILIKLRVSCQQKGRNYTPFFISGYLLISSLKLP